jgi:hypothetical protein
VQWLNTYSALLDRSRRDGSLRLTFVGYERLCAEPAAVWSELAEQFKLQPALPTKLIVRPLRPSRGVMAESRWVPEAQQVYSELVAASLK